MPRSCETSRTLIFLAIAILCTLSLLAQKAQETNRPKYDVNTEIKVKGTVEEVKLPPKGNEKEIAHLLLKTGTDTVDVYLCPKSFLDDMGVSFSKGEEIAVTGSKVKLGETDLILAREVVKGTDTLVLRDAKGNPVWS
jgi:DNA/RNA endonuclease YhcR with UshA esterase domain